MTSSSEHSGGQNPMYSPSVQQAIESGDLPRMKELAVKAREYIEHAKSIEKLAQQLNAEIERIERKR